MEYLKRLFVTALADAWRMVGGGPVSVLVVTGVIVGVTVLFYRSLAGTEAAKDQVRWTLSAVAATIAVAFLLLLVNFFFFTPMKLYEEKAQAAQRVDELHRELEHRRHTIVTSDPVFPNIIYLLQAFRMYRVALGHDTRCTVYITAPPDSAETASMVQQFSIATSNCATFMTGTDTPTLEREALDGTVPGFITLNAPEGSRTADALFAALTPHFRTRRGYRAIPQGRLAEVQQEYVWLQFGNGVRFDSELREAEARQQGSAENPR